MTTLLQFVVITSALGGLAVSLYRVLWIYAVRVKARRVFDDRRLVDAAMRRKLRAPDPVLVEKALKELRDAMKEKSVKKEFSSAEYKAIGKILSRRDGAKHFLAI